MDINKQQSPWQRRPVGSQNLPPVKLTFELSNEQLNAQPSPQLLYALLTLKGQDIPQKVVQPINLCLVLDRSSSMKGEKFEQVKAATIQLLGSIQADDVLSIIAFSDRATPIVTCRSGAKLDEIEELLAEMTTFGGTEIAQGIETGLKEMRAGSSENRISHMILLTDGHTYGDEERCRKLASEAAKENISITTLGVGLEWNDALLASIATTSYGRLEYIDQPQRIVRVFTEQIEHLRNILVKQAAIVLRKPGVIQIRSIDQIVPHIQHLDATKETIPVGTIGRGEERSFLIEFLVPPQAEPSRMGVVECELGYQSAIPGQRSPAMASRLQGQMRARLEVEFVNTTLTGADTLTALNSSINPNVMHALERQVVFRLQEKAWEEAQRGEIVAATSHLNMSANHLVDMGVTELAQTIRHEAKQLAATGTISLASHKQVHYGTRGLKLPPSSGS